MAKQFDALTEDHRSFIAAQPLFFCGTAAPDGRVNVSPKGMDSLRVLDVDRIIWLNLTGSGNETAGHLAAHPRMTLMWASFSTRPLILRCYGTARMVQRDNPDWPALSARFGAQPGARQVYDMRIEMVQTSCGWAMPFMDHTGERDVLTRWAEGKGAEGIRSHWREKNARTIDGAPTGIEGNLQ